MMNTFDMTAFCKALSDETRQKILQVLQDYGEQCVSDLVECFHLAQPTISHHLNFLRQANLVLSRKEGKQIYYRANQENITECCGILFTKLVPADIQLQDVVNQEVGPKK